MPVRALSRLFAGRVFALARDALPGVRLPFIAAPRWVVWCAPTVQGADRVLSYLARYVFRSAITNARLSSVDGDAVRFRVHSHDTRAARVVILVPHEFLRRFLQHVLPRGLHKVRFYGLWHPAHRAARDQLAASLAGSVRRAPPHSRDTDSPPHPFHCPSCGCEDLVLLGRVPRSPLRPQLTDRPPPHASRCSR